MNYRLQRNLQKIFLCVGLTLILLIVLIPIWYMFSSSFKTGAQMLDMSQFIFFEPTLDIYKRVFSGYDILRPMRNSLIISIAATGLACLLGVPASYSIARHHMHKFSSIILIVRIIPAISFLVPWYMLLSRIHWVGTFQAVILANLLTLLPLIIWIVSPYFQTIPKELEDAAFIDGCSEIQSFLTIMIPLAIPGILTAVILSFINAWNNFMFSYVLGGSNVMTLPMMLQLFMGYDTIDLSGMMAASCIIVAPVVIISICLQKYVVSGLTAGAVKG